MIRYAPAATPLRPCRAGLVERMASDMREMAFAGETVSAETLTQRGWTPGAIERFAPDAVNLARRQSIRRLESGRSPQHGVPASAARPNPGRAELKGGADK